MPYQIIWESISLGDPSPTYIHRTPRYRISTTCVVQGMVYFAVSGKLSIGKLIAVLLFGGQQRCNKSSSLLVPVLLCSR